MKDYLRDVLYDVILSIVTKKFGTSLNDSQKEEKAEEFISELHENNFLIVEKTQLLINKIGFNNFYTTQVNGKSVYALAKEGMFHKVKVCWFITRSKDNVDGKYLEQIYDELSKQANGDNIFESKEYKRG
ncbi:hypothetical protein [uncultured Ruminococcus sp.]|uniref:hypothetical protein n=1 Tax=uncultured Ruminococcus sp. TaxID=165186 RepID=UPI0025EB3C28|nr:hypothetical protein [uncultured Ruminococcus sp.]